MRFHTFPYMVKIEGWPTDNNTFGVICVNSFMAYSRLSEFET